MVILGGSDSVVGSAIGALFFVILPEALRWVGISGDRAINIRDIVYGLLLILVIKLRRQGLLGRYSMGGDSFASRKA